ncbi:MAG: replicative DNA helicase [Rickettsiales bacterium]|nr:replicative DNA helicase [Rickettsiales bacterium]
MATALSLDDQDSNTEDKLHREAPYNLEAEQALLGAVLTNNEALNHVSQALLPEHFYAEIHQRIYGAILKFYDKGLIANPVTLKHHFTDEDAVDDHYLARLVASAATVINVFDYSQIIADLAVRRMLIGIGEDVVNTAYNTKVEASGMEQVEVAEQALFNLATEGTSEGGFQPLKSALAESIIRTETAYKNQGSVVGISTGLDDLDRLLGGLMDSDLIILAGRPSMGKTALATTIAFNAARILHRKAEETPGEKPKSVGFFSLEMSAEQLANRMLASACGINSNKLQRGDLSNEEFTELVRRSNELSAIPYHIDDTPALSIAAVRTRARRLKRVHNVGLLVVDYLQLLRGTSASSQANRVQEISEITQGLKAIAKELNIPVIALSQLSRAVEQREDKRPQLSDLRESGSIEQDADVVMFVYREEYYLARTEPRPDTPEHAAWMERMEQAHGVADAIIAKQRHGPIGTVNLQFQASLTRFDNLAQEDRLPERHF